MIRDRHALIDGARDVLAANWRGGYTVPHGSLYPFQWLWDSGFTAIGHGHLDPERAQLELRSLFAGQWPSGLLPHIVFHRHDPGYFPGPEAWDVTCAPERSPEVATSGITQPPVIGFVLEMLWHRARDGQAWRRFADSVYPALVRFHEYLYRRRDPHGHGLVYIQHPWESGADNAPTWDAPLAAIAADQATEVESSRRDIAHVHPDQRPLAEHYARYMHLVRVFRACRYDDACIARRSPFLVQDAFFNAILIRSNASLIAIGRALGRDVSQIEAWNEAGRIAMDRTLWNADRNTYDSWDLRAGRRIGSESSLGSIGPLFAGIPGADRAARMVAALRDRFVPPGHYWCPTVAPGTAAFEPRRYWRGPVWVNTNWMLYHGLRGYGLDDVAEQVRQDTIDAVRRCGYHEYFSPRRDAPEGLGASRFSWSAALCLDLLASTDPGYPALLHAPRTPASGS